MTAGGVCTTALTEWKAWHWIADNVKSVQSNTVLAISTPNLYILNILLGGSGCLSQTTFIKIIQQFFSHSLLSVWAETETIKAWQFSCIEMLIRMKVTRGGKLTAGIQIEFIADHRPCSPLLG